jgi:eukaryotic-like serine/threonine-protein kinase
LPEPDRDLVGGVCLVDEGMASFVHCAGIMTPNNIALGPGSIVGSYRIVKQIGVGGMGEVFEATHALLPRRVALKVLHGDLSHGSGMDSRMIQEASILDGVRHPGIVRVFECGLLGDRRPWIAMELVSGESLATRLARDVQLAPSEVCDLVASLADILATVHEGGIVHRDLKPENVLLAATGAGFSVRIIDWGVARLGPTARLTRPGVTCGTPTYMSPEQAAGRDIAAPCDMYSLGVIAYEALAGHAPFDGRTLAEVVALHLHGEAAPLFVECPTAPQALCDLIHEMLQKAASARPTAAEVRDRMSSIAQIMEDAHSEFESYDITTKPWLPTPNLEWLPSLVALAPSAMQSVTIGRPSWTPELPLSVPGQWGSALSERTSPATWRRVLSARKR